MFAPRGDWLRFSLSRQTLPNVRRLYPKKVPPKDQWLSWHPSAAPSPRPHAPQSLSVIVGLMADRKASRASPASKKRSRTVKDVVRDVWQRRDLRSRDVIDVDALPKHDVPEKRPRKLLKQPPPPPGQPPPPTQPPPAPKTVIDVDDEFRADFLALDSGADDGLLFDA